MPHPSSHPGKRFIFEKAKELGVRSVLIDGPDSWSQVGWAEWFHDSPGTSGGHGRPGMDLDEDAAA